MVTTNRVWSILKFWTAKTPVDASTAIAGHQQRLTKTEDVELSLCYRSQYRCQMLIETATLEFRQNRLNDQADFFRLRALPGQATATNGFICIPVAGEHALQGVA
jgi:hypothetical protein